MPNYKYDSKKRKRQKAEKQKEMEKVNPSNSLKVTTPGRPKKKTKPNSTQGSPPTVDARIASESTRRRRANDLLKLVNDDLDLLRLALSIGKLHFLIKIGFFKYF